MLLNDRKQLIAGPPAASPDRLPTSCANRRPVVHRNRLRTGDHHRVQRHLLEPVLVLLTHRASLDELKTDRPHANEKDRRQHHDYCRTHNQRASLIPQFLSRETQQPERTERNNSRQAGKKVTPVNRSAVVEEQQEVGPERNQPKQQHRRQPPLAPLQKRRERNRKKHERRADEVEHDVRREIGERDGMARRLLAHRLAPAKPNPAVVRIADEPVSKPSKRQQQKDHARRNDIQNLATLKLPSQHKWREHEPRRIESNRLSQIYAESHQARAGEDHPKLLLLRSEERRVGKECR